MQEDQLEQHHRLPFNVADVFRYNTGGGNPARAARLHLYPSDRDTPPPHGAVKNESYVFRERETGVYLSARPYPLYDSYPVLSPPMELPWIRTTAALVTAVDGVAVAWPGADYVEHLVRTLTKDVLAVMEKYRPAPVYKHAITPFLGIHEQALADMLFSCLPQGYPTPLPADTISIRDITAWYIRHGSRSVAVPWAGGVSLSAAYTMDEQESGYDPKQLTRTQKHLAYLRKRRNEVKSMLEPEDYQLETFVPQVFPEFMRPLNYAGRQPVIDKLMALVGTNIVAYLHRHELIPIPRDVSCKLHEYIFKLLSIFVFMHAVCVVLPVIQENKVKLIGYLKEAITASMAIIKRGTFHIFPPVHEQAVDAIYTMVVRAFPLTGDDRVNIEKVMPRKFFRVVAVNAWSVSDAYRLTFKHVMGRAMTVTDAVLGKHDRLVRMLQLMKPYMAEYTDVRGDEYRHAYYHNGLTFLAAYKLFKFIYRILEQRKVAFLEDRSTLFTKMFEFQAWAYSSCFQHGIPDVENPYSDISKAFVRGYKELEATVKQFKSDMPEEPPMWTRFDIVTHGARVRILATYMGFDDTDFPIDFDWSPGVAGLVDVFDMLFGLRSNGLALMNFKRQFLFMILQTFPVSLDPLEWWGNFRQLHPFMKRNMQEFLAALKHIIEGKQSLSHVLRTYTEFAFPVNGVFTETTFPRSPARAYPVIRARQLYDIVSLYMNTYIVRRAYADFKQKVPAFVSGHSLSVGVSPLLLEEMMDGSLWSRDSMFHALLAFSPRSEAIYVRLYSLRVIRARMMDIRERQRRFADPYERAIGDIEIDPVMVTKAQTVPIRIRIHVLSKRQLDMLFVGWIWRPARDKDTAHPYRWAASPVPAKHRVQVLNVPATDGVEGEYYMVVGNTQAGWMRSGAVRARVFLRCVRTGLVFQEEHNHNTAALWTTHRQRYWWTIPFRKQLLDTVAQRLALTIATSDSARARKFVAVLDKRQEIEEARPVVVPVLEPERPEEPEEPEEPVVADVRVPERGFLAGLRDWFRDPLAFMYEFIGPAQGFTGASLAQVMKDKPWKQPPLFADMASVPGKWRLNKYYVSYGPNTVGGVEDFARRFWNTLHKYTTRALIGDYNSFGDMVADMGLIYAMLVENIIREAVTLSTEDKASLREYGRTLEGRRNEIMAEVSVKLDKKVTIDNVGWHSAYTRDPYFTWVPPDRRQVLGLEAGAPAAGFQLIHTDKFDAKFSSYVGDSLARMDEFMPFWTHTYRQLIATARVPVAFAYPMLAWVSLIHAHLAWDSRIPFVLDVGVSGLQTLTKDASKARAVELFGRNSRIVAQRDPDVWRGLVRLSAKMFGGMFFVQFRRVNERMREVRRVYRELREGTRAVTDETLAEMHDLMHSYAGVHSLYAQVLDARCDNYEDQLDLEELVADAPPRAGAILPAPFGRDFFRRDDIQLLLANPFGAGFFGPRAPRGGGPGGGPGGPGGPGGGGPGGPRGGPSGAPFGPGFFRGRPGDDDGDRPGRPPFVANFFPHLLPQEPVLPVVQHPPAQAPVEPPAQGPAQPPVQPPVQPPAQVPAQPPQPPAEPRVLSRREMLMAARIAEFMVRKFADRAANARVDVPEEPQEEEPLEEFFDAAGSSLVDIRKYNEVVAEIAQRGQEIAPQLDQAAAQVQEAQQTRDDVQSEVERAVGDLPEALERVQAAQASSVSEEGPILKDLTEDLKSQVEQQFFDEKKSEAMKILGRMQMVADNYALVVRDHDREYKQLVGVLRDASEGISMMLKGKEIPAVFEVKVREFASETTGLIVNLGKFRDTLRTRQEEYYRILKEFVEVDPELGAQQIRDARANLETLSVDRSKRTESTIEWTVQLQTLLGELVRSKEDVNRRQTLLKTLGRKVDALQQQFEAADDRVTENIQKVQAQLEEQERIRKEKERKQKLKEHKRKVEEAKLKKARAKSIKKFAKTVSGTLEERERQVQELKERQAELESEKRAAIGKIVFLERLEALEQIREEEERKLEKAKRELERTRTKSQQNQGTLGAVFDETTKKITNTSKGKGKAKAGVFPNFTNLWGRVTNIVGSRSDKPSLRWYDEELEEAADVMANIVREILEVNSARLINLLTPVGFRTLKSFVEVHLVAHFASVRNEIPRDIDYNFETITRYAAIDIEKRAGEWGPTKTKPADLARILAPIISAVIGLHFLNRLRDHPTLDIDIATVTPTTAPPLVPNQVADLTGLRDMWQGIAPQEGLPQAYVGPLEQLRTVASTGIQLLIVFWLENERKMAASVATPWSRLPGADDPRPVNDTPSVGDTHLRSPVSGAVVLTPRSATGEPVARAQVPVEVEDDAASMASLSSLFGVVGRVKGVLGRTDPASGSGSGTGASFSAVDARLVAAPVSTTGSMFEQTEGVFESDDAELQLYDSAMLTKASAAVAWRLLHESESEDVSTETSDTVSPFALRAPPTFNIVDTPKTIGDILKAGPGLSEQADLIVKEIAAVAFEYKRLVDIYLTTTSRSAHANLLAFVKTVPIDKFLATATTSLTTLTDFIDAGSSIVFNTPKAPELAETHLRVARIIRNDLLPHIRDVVRTYELTDQIPRTYVLQYTRRWTSSVWFPGGVWDNIVTSDDKDKDFAALREDIRVIEDCSTNAAVDTLLVTVMDMLKRAIESKDTFDMMEVIEYEYLFREQLMAGIADTDTCLARAYRAFAILKKASHVHGQRFGVLYTQLNKLTMLILRRRNRLFEVFTGMKHIENPELGSVQDIVRVAAAHHVRIISEQTLVYSQDETIDKGVSMASEALQEKQDALRDFLYPVLEQWEAALGRIEFWMHRAFVIQSILPGGPDTDLQNALDEFQEYQRKIAFVVIVGSRIPPKPLLDKGESDLTEFIRAQVTPAASSLDQSSTTVSF